MKDKKILFGIILAFIFLLSIGLTYAYFAVTTNVIGDRNDIKASVGTLSILYTDGPEITANNIQPGWNATKTVKVKNTGTLEAFYSLDWATLVNEIENDELTFSATCTSDIGTCLDIENTPVTDSELAMGVRIKSGEEQTYVITFQFIEISSVQNYNQNKKFNGVLNVIESSETFTLSGLLLDSGGNPVENATIEVHSILRTGVTDSNGVFNIKGIEVGNHEINVKNSSDVSIATDSISLLSGEAEVVTNKQITGNKNKSTIDIKITLGESNINTISISGWYDRCNTGSTDIKCKLLTSNVEYADNVSSTYVSSPYGIDFSQLSSDTNGKGLYYTTDSSETENGARVYYFRGAVENNYLIFGGYCFRIVRTVEDGSTRLRYGGIPTEGVCPQTGTDVSILPQMRFHVFGMNNANIGYMYGNPSGSTYDSSHTNTTSSDIKKAIDAWYSGGTTSNHECSDGNLIDNCDFTSLTSKLINNSSLIADTPYCNDRSIGTGGTVGGSVFTELGYGQNNTLYGSLRRIGTGGPTGTSFDSANANPSYKCPQKNDKFTVSSSNGNGALTYPIALITADEAAYAGFYAYSYWTPYGSNYLYTSKFYWSMTPAYFKDNLPYIFEIGAGNAGIDSTGLYYTGPSLIPVISLKSSANVASGTGVYNNPYIIN